MTDTLIFIDLEASGFSGFPIELGWAIVDRATGAIDSDAMLIRHDPWLSDIGLWSAHAESVHGIPRETLEREGLPIRAVADRFDTIAGGHAVLSDAPSFDGWWLSWIYGALGRPMPFFLIPVGAALASCGADPALVAEARSNDKVAHRAEADARFWAELYVRAAGLSRRTAT